MRRVVILVALQLGFNLSFLVRAVRGCFSHAQCGDDAHPGAHALEYSSSPPAVGRRRLTVTIAVALAVGGRCGRWWGKAAYVAPLLDPSSGRAAQSTAVQRGGARPRRRPVPGWRPRRRRRSRSCSGWAGRAACAVSRRGAGARAALTQPLTPYGRPQEMAYAAAYSVLAALLVAALLALPLTTAPRTLLPKREGIAEDAADATRRRRLAARWSRCEPSLRGSCRRASSRSCGLSRSLSTRAASPPRVGVGGERVGGGAGRRRRRARRILLATARRCADVRGDGALRTGLRNSRRTTPRRSIRRPRSLILVAVEEGQGFILFLCFGLQPEVVARSRRGRRRRGTAAAAARRRGGAPNSPPPSLITDPLLIYSSVMPPGSPAARAPPGPRRLAHRHDAGSDDGDRRNIGHVRG